MKRMGMRAGVSALGVGLALAAVPASALTYRSTASYPAGGTQTFAVAVQDLNGDGHADLVTVNVFEDTVSVLLGNGTGALGSPAVFSVSVTEYPELPSSVAVADYDGDGAADLAVSLALGGEGIHLLFGDGSGGFGRGALVRFGDSRERNTRKVVAGDIDSDGDADLVSVSAWLGTMAVFLGQGDGTFASPREYAMADGPFGANEDFLFDVDLADIDGDGDLDVAAANDSGGIGNDDDLIVRLGNGDGTFGPIATAPAGGNPVNVALDDLDGDGDADAVLALRDRGSVAVMFNDGLGSFGPPSLVYMGAHPRDVVVADLDEDGTVDVATIIDDEDDLFVLLGRGDGTFPRRNRFTVGALPFGLATGDFDEDGSPDLVTANRGSGDVTLLLQPDTDEDGLSNAEERDLGTDHLDADSDDDGLGDGEEVAGGTDPNDADSDDDGIPDGFEAAAAAIEGVPDDALHSGGARTAMLSRLAAIGAQFQAGQVEDAVLELQNLRRWVDGCATSGAPDHDDKVTDCEEQAVVRDAIDALLARLGA